MVSASSISTQTYVLTQEIAPTVPCLPQSQLMPLGKAQRGTTTQTCTAHVSLQRDSLGLCLSISPHRPAGMRGRTQGTLARPGTRARSVRGTWTGLSSTVTKMLRVGAGAGYQCCFSHEACLRKWSRTNTRVTEFRAGQGAGWHTPARQRKETLTDARVTQAGVATPPLLCRVHRALECTRPDTFQLQTAPEAALPHGSPTFTSHISTANGGMHLGLSVPSPVPGGTRVPVPQP